MFESSKKDSADYATKGMQMRIVGAFVVIGALIVLSQIVLLWLLAGQQYRTHVVEVAASQRVLSQQIVKNSYRLVGVGTTEARRNAYEELRNALTRMERAHAGLQHGSEELNLPGANSSRITRLFGDLEPDYQAFTGAAAKVLATAEIPGEVHQAVQRLGEHEGAFLSGMGEIVSRYESEARDRIGYVRWLGLGFGLLTLGALVFVAHKIFTPLILRMHGEMQRHERHAAELGKLFFDSPAAMFLVDTASFAIVRGNRKAEALLGCSAEELVGRPFSALFDPRLEANKRFLKKIRAGEVLDEHEVLLVGAKQNLVEALASSRQFADSKQRGFLIAVTDVTVLSRSAE